MKAVIGIDNGARSGAMCALCPESGAVLEYALMPSREHYRKTEADPIALVRWVSSFDVVAVGIEEAPAHAASMQAMRSMAMSFGLCFAALEQAGLNPHRISVSDWQKAMLGKVPKGMTKPYALAKANELWPGQGWFASKRSSTAHDGIIDAALIASYLRRSFC